MIAASPIVGRGPTSQAATGKRGISFSFMVGSFLERVVVWQSNPIRQELTAQFRSANARP
ncbi:phage protein [Bordetella avium 197N]|uniref:Phage protein n=1 Tax=Bordetella avium (strain 197N) TaxID=360910 RepID=Q2L2G1_BORA1|nr:phage protein [Bordetella avium 197N]